MVKLHFLLFRIFLDPFTNISLYWIQISLHFPGSYYEILYQFDIGNYVFMTLCINCISALAINGIKSTYYIFSNSLIFIRIYYYCFFKCLSNLFLNMVNLIFFHIVHLIYSFTFFHSIIDYISMQQIINIISLNFILQKSNK